MSAILFPYTSYSKSSSETFSSSPKIREEVIFQLFVMIALDLFTRWGREVPHPCINTSLCVISDVLSEVSIFFNLVSLQAVEAVHF